MSGQRWRLIITLALVAVCVFMFWNTFKLWTMSEADRQAMQKADPGALLHLQQKAIRLGLDLQGGIHVVMRVKTEELDDASREGAVDRAMQVIRSRVDALGVAEPNIQKQGDDRVIVDLPGYTDAERAEELIGRMAVLEFKLLENYENAQLLIAKIDSVVQTHEMESKGADTAKAEEAASLETPDTAASGTDVMADLMGDSDVDTSAFAFDESTLTEETDRPFSSRLEPVLYNNTTGTSFPGYTVDRRDRQRMERWLDLPEVKRLIPIDVQWAWGTRPVVRSNREVYELYLLKRKVHFLGKYLKSITLGRGQMGGPQVDFRIDAEGISRFAQLTGANINKPLAVVLDGMVESAPFINSKIRGDGTITMGSSATMQDALDMKVVLEAGSLPAPVEIIEKNVVGASLGADSISKGFTASVIGLLVVLLYIGVYYRLSGVIADIGLVFNIFFLLAFMAGFHFTLTMPGIAGIILTIGISVDSNILIFERIREEIRTGKTVRAAIDAGYQRAFVAIFDSHVTTLITAGALFLFGSGPVRGFAVTLFLGVAISLYTAYVITKSIFDIRKQYETLSI